MPELIVVEKIDGNPVAWRCSDCRQSFFVGGKFSTQERRKKVTAEFEVHIEENHTAQDFVAGMAVSLGRH